MPSDAEIKAMLEGAEIRSHPDARTGWRRGRSRTTDDGAIRERSQPDLVLRLDRQRARQVSAAPRLCHRDLRLQRPRPVRHAARHAQSRQRPRDHRPVLEPLRRRLVRGRQETTRSWRCCAWTRITPRSGSTNRVSLPVSSSCSAQIPRKNTRTRSPKSAFADAPARPGAGPSVAKRIEPVVDVLLGFILGNAVALLQRAFELLALAVDGDEVGHR